jgi:hypothetical protein
MIWRINDRINDKCLGAAGKDLTQDSSKSIYGDALPEKEEEKEHILQVIIIQSDDVF